MRYLTLVSLLSVSLAAEVPPDCSGPAAFVDVRCSCVKDPSSQLCQLFKTGVYDGNLKMWKPSELGLGGAFGRPTSPAPGTQQMIQSPQPARPRQARVVPLATKDYLRFLHPNAKLVAGFDFEKIFRSPELMRVLFSSGDGRDMTSQIVAALKEMDHLWLSLVPPADGVVLMTGKFEQGGAAGMFYAQGIRPVFLGGSHAMMIGAEPSIQAALARLAKPAATGGWVARRARELSKDHEAWIVNQLAPGTHQGAAALQGIRQFALGFRLSGEAGLDGEVVADSQASAQQIAAWVVQMKAAIREKTGVGALDALTIEPAGSTLRFAAKGDSLLTGEAGKAVMNSDFGVELYAIIMSGFPGVPARTVAGEKLLAVKSGMKREEVLTLLGRPLSVSAIQGLDTPRETWTYQVPFGKQLTVRLDDGVVTVPPR